MNKIVRIIITVILITTVINLTGCSKEKETDTFAIETKLGDSLIAEVSLSGSMHHCFLHYYIGRLYSRPKVECYTLHVLPGFCPIATK